MSASMKLSLSPSKGSSPKGSPSKAAPEKITAATGFELTPLCEVIVKLGKEQEEECDDLEEDIKDMEAELADLHNDIEQDKLDCKHYEELLAQKEIELEQRAVEVEEMKKVNRQRQIDLNVRDDELDAREIQLAGKVMAPELSEHKKKMKGLKAEIRGIDEAGANKGQSEIHVNDLGALHAKQKHLRCQTQWAEQEIEFFTKEVAVHSSQKVQKHLKEHKKKLRKKDKQVREAMVELKVLQSTLKQLGGSVPGCDALDYEEMWCTLELSDVSDGSDSDKEDQEKAEEKAEEQSAEKPAEEPAPEEAEVKAPTLDVKEPSLDVEVKGPSLDVEVNLGGEEKKAEDKGDESSPEEEEGVAVVVGLRIQVDGESKLRKIKLECDPKTKGKKIIKAVNKTLKKADVDMSIERLVPLWTPTWDHLDKDKVMIKLLKHSQNGAGEDFDAREMDPIRMVGVDADQFDSDFWNEHLDFLHEEFEWFDAEEFTDGSD